MEYNEQSRVETGLESESAGHSCLEYCSEVVSCLPRRHAPEHSTRGSRSRVEARALPRPQPFSVAPSAPVP